MCRKNTFETDIEGSYGRNRQRRDMLKRKFEDRRTRHEKDVCVEVERR